MCGICGVLNVSPSHRIDRSVIQQMLEMIRHRGPDGCGIYSDKDVSLGNARLSIIDLETGNQPISNEDETLWIVFNGEIFNYIELREELERRGHRFKTKSDTETLLHAYEEFGVTFLKRVNGQFSLAIWDNVNQTLFLARDRLGILPLFYTIHEKKLIFGSEIKALLAYPGIRAEIDPNALQQVFTFWSVQSPRSIFTGIKELPPGHYLIAKRGQISVEAFWSLDFAQPISSHTENEYLDELESLLIDSTRLRLRSDVPVGVYLSGGLDSSIITSLIRSHSNYPLETFSISFTDPEFDESHFQLEVANYFNARHNIVKCSYEDIGSAFPDVIWHTETPILRTAPAPMFLLSKLVADSGYKVVLTGEGADEFLAGYDIFKEMQVRRFWAKDPESALRPLLFKRLYSDIESFSAQQVDYLKAFFKKGLLETDSPYYSHVLRWNNSARNLRFIRSTDQKLQLSFDSLPANFFRWSPLAKAQYLEIMTFMSPYLLSSQGDRMAMANSVEARQPFLDHRMVEFCNRLPDTLKLNGLKEKWILKRLGAKLLPVSIWKRGKKPFRAPINQCFFTKPPDYVKELLSEKCIKENGFFNTGAAMAMIEKASSASKLSEVDAMAVAGIISIQLLHQLFIKNFQLKAINPTVLKVIER
ncbi:MAG: asparagine synthase (glutamine-hydrolyzing) [Bacteroidetes bacterium]|nr:asparagine synthase (glutamine-hydrolyzing) [Bacteroidota bacterium]